MKTGSPEWFREKASLNAYMRYQERAEELRYSFLERFSPEKLASMTEKELLSTVFDDGDTMLMMLEKKDGEYNIFGSIAYRKYLNVLYKKDGVWRYNENNNAKTISHSEALTYAVDIRDSLNNCIDIIGKSSLDSVEEYKKLYEEIAGTFFSQRLWALKYYQMVYPQFFPALAKGQYHSLFLC